MQTSNLISGRDCTVLLAAAAAGFYFWSLSRPPWLAPCRCQRDKPHASRSKSAAGVEDETDDFGTGGLVKKRERITTLWGLWDQYRQGMCLRCICSATQLDEMLILLRSEKALKNLASDPKTAQPLRVLLSNVFALGHVAVAGLLGMRNFWGLLAKKINTFQVNGPGALSVSRDALVPALLPAECGATDVLGQNSQPDRAEDVSVYASIERVENISPDKVELRLSARREKTALDREEDVPSNFDPVCRADGASVDNRMPRVLVAKMWHSASPHAQIGSARADSEHTSPASFSDDLSQGLTIADSRGDDYYEYGAMPVAEVGEVGDDGDTSGDEHDGEVQCGRAHAIVFSSRSPAVASRSTIGSAPSTSEGRTIVAPHLPGSFTRSPPTPGRTTFNASPLSSVEIVSREGDDGLRSNAEAYVRRGEKYESAWAIRQALEAEHLRREEAEWNRLADLRKQQGRQIEEDKRREEAARKRQEEEAAQARQRMEEERRQEEERRKRAEESKRADEERRREQEREETARKRQEEEAAQARQRMEEERKQEEERRKRADEEEQIKQEREEAARRKQSQVVGSKWQEDLAENFLFNLSSWAGHSGDGRMGSSQAAAAAAAVGGPKGECGAEREGVSNRQAEGAGAEMVAGVYSLTGHSIAMSPDEEVTGHSIAIFHHEEIAIFHDEEVSVGLTNARKAKGLT